MKKYSCITIIVAMAVVLLFSCTKKESATDKSLTNVLEKKTFVLGLDDSMPPLGFRNENNEIIGYDIDLAREVTSRLGVELKLQPIDWAAKEQELNTGNIDCIWNGFTITPEREKVINYTDPYLNNAIVAVVRTDSKIDSLSDLNGKKASLQAGSSAVDALNANPELKSKLEEVVEFRDYLTAFMDLEAGGVSAVLIDEVMARYNITKSGKKFMVLEEKLAAEKYGIGFRKGDQALRDAVQNTLKAMAADGTITNISTKWFGSDISIIGK